MTDEQKPQKEAPIDPWARIRTLEAENQRLKNVVLARDELIAHQQRQVEHFSTQRSAQEWEEMRHRVSALQQDLAATARDNTFLSNQVAAGRKKIISRGWFEPVLRQEVPYRPTTDEIKALAGRLAAWMHSDDDDSYDQIRSAAVALIAHAGQVYARTDDDEDARYEW